MTTAREAQVQRDAQHDALTALIQGKVCGTCDGYPFVAWIKGDFVLRCNCWPKPPVLASEYKHILGRRQWDMTTKALARLDEHGIKSVNAEVMTEEVRSLLPSAGKATQNEVRLFVRFCQSLGANPFIGEVYLIKYAESQPASIVVGLAWHLKQAAKNPAYQGYKAGLIIQGADALEYREGAFILPDEKLVGGWCEVHRQGWTVAPRHTVALQEYFAGGRERKNLWDTKPATMILKVAINQAIRRAFPEEASETERTIAAANLHVIDEGQAGVDLEEQRSSLSDDAVIPVGQAPAHETAVPVVRKQQAEQRTAPQPPVSDASNEFWPKVRQQHPGLDSQTVLTHLGIKMFTEWKGTVDEALAKVAEKAKAQVKTGG